MFPIHPGSFTTQISKKLAIFAGYAALFLIVFLVCDFSACTDTNNTVASLDEIMALYTLSPIIVDGILDEQIWHRTQMVLLKNNKTGDAIEDVRNQTQVRTCFNETYIYISFVCYDADIWGDYSERDQHLWKEEAVEVFIDTDDEPNSYVEIEVSPNNVLFDSYIIDPQNIDIAATKKFDLPGIQTSVFVKGTMENRDDTDERWDVEIAIPISDLTQKEKYASCDSLWKINFYRINRDPDKDSEGYAWSPTFGRFHKPSAFGVLRFQK